MERRPYRKRRGRRLRREIKRSGLNRQRAGVALEVTNRERTFAALHDASANAAAVCDGADRELLICRDVEYVRRAEEIVLRRPRRRRRVHRHRARRAVEAPLRTRKPLLLEVLLDCCHVRLSEALAVDQHLGDLHSSGLILVVYLDHAEAEAVGGGKIVGRHERKNLPPAVEASPSGIGDDGIQTDSSDNGRQICALPAAGGKA